MTEPGYEYEEEEWDAVIAVLHKQLKRQMEGDFNKGIYEHVEDFMDELRQEMQPIIDWAEGPRP